MQGCGRQTPRIAAALEHPYGDVVILGEHKAFGPLAAGLARAGWAHQVGDPDTVPTLALPLATAAWTHANYASHSA